MKNLPWKGRGQGHVSNFYIMDLKNFATASRRYTGDIHNSVRRRFVYDTYKIMEVTRSRHGWVHMFITHRPTVTLQLHNFSLFRTCRTSSFCTVAWQLARFQLTRRIARSVGDSWASCYIQIQCLRCYWMAVCCKQINTALSWLVGRSVTALVRRSGAVRVVGLFRRVQPYRPAGVVCRRAADRHRARRQEGTQDAVRLHRRRRRRPRPRVWTLPHHGNNHPLLTYTQTQLTAPDPTWSSSGGVAIRHVYRKTTQTSLYLVDGTVQHKIKRISPKRLRSSRE